MENKPNSEFFFTPENWNLINLVKKDPETNQFPLKIAWKTSISHDTYEWELDFPDKNWQSGI
jgi:hypothetical protein